MPSAWRELPLALGVQCMAPFKKKNHKFSSALDRMMAHGGHKKLDRENTQKTGCEVLFAPQFWGLKTS